MCVGDCFFMTPSEGFKIRPAAYFCAKSLAMCMRIVAIVTICVVFSRPLLPRIRGLGMCRFDFDHQYRTDSNINFVFLKYYQISLRNQSETNGEIAT